MPVLMKNCGIFTKIIVLQESRSKEAKIARTATEKTKVGRKIIATFEQLLQQNIRKMVEESLGHSNFCCDKN